MGIGVDSREFADALGGMTRHVLGLDFMVGPDNPLIRLYQLASRKRPGAGLRIGDLDANEVFETGVFGRTHLVDVSSDDPHGYFFVSYAPRIRIVLSDDMTGRRLASCRWSALREFGLFDYHRIKEAGAPELSQIDLRSGDVASVNRRLVLPLIGDRRQISHLLVSIVPDQQDVVPHTLQ